MPSSRSLPATRVPFDEPRITVGVAATTWVICWLVGNLIGAAILSASGHSGDPLVELPVWLTLASALSLWIPTLVALGVVSDRFGTRSFAVDFVLGFQPIDVFGLSVGVLAQLVLLPLVYLPLRSAWPDTFNRTRLEQNAGDLYDSAHGGWLVVLVIVVVVGAPLVEELLYRGLLQHAFAARMNDVVAVVVVAAWFAIIHFRPIEYPGLFAFGLVLGTCVLLTRRLGMGMLAHLAFNATGLILVAR
jgi:membrane protease YdiL (CAAX protease family)